MARDHKTKLTQALKLIDSDSRGLFVEELSQKIGEVVDNARAKTALVQSAVELTTDEQRRIENLLKKILQRQLDIDYRVTPAVIGGFAISVGDWKLDASLKTQLENLKESLNFEPNKI